MATADDETPTYISKAIGDYTFKARSTSYSQARMFDHNIQISDQGAPLLRPEQVRLLDDNNEIVLIKGHPPLKLRKVRYYSDRMLRRLFECQIGALPEPASLMLSEGVHRDGQDLSQQAAVTEAQGLGDIDSIPNNMEAATPQNSEMDDEQDSLPTGIDVPQGLIESDEVKEDAGGVVPDFGVSAEMAPAMIAQQQLLEQIIALQQRYGPASSHSVK